MMKCLFSVVALAFVFSLCGCQGNKRTVPVINASDSVHVEEIEDSTIYGVCGEGTSMHNLQLISDGGDSLSVFIDEENPNVVQGGLLAGDRVALIACKNQETGYVAQKIINITSLLGKWTSIDKNFDLIEGGEVRNNVKAETNPWTSWKILNGKLLLNKDTFEIDKLGPDSLYLENSVGIFTFKRQE